MRLIFLDFDGVLHPLEAEFEELGRFCWLPILTELLTEPPRESWRPVGLSQATTMEA